MPPSDSVHEPESSRVVEADYVHTPAEAVRSALAMSRATRPLAPVLPWLGAVVIAIAAYQVLTDTEAWRRVWLPAALGVALLVLLPLQARWTIRRKFSGQPGAHAQIRWRIDAERLQSQGPFGETTVAWNELHAVRPMKHGYLLFTQPGFAQWLPRSAFRTPADAAQFHAWSVRTPGRSPFPDTAVPRTAPVAIAADALPPMLVVKFIYTVEEAARARRAMHQSIPVWMRVAPSLPLYLAACVVLVLLLRHGDWRLVAAFCAAGAVVSLLAWRQQHRHRARVFAASPNAEREVHWRVDAERLEVVGAHTNSSFLWSAVLKVRETADGFLIFEQPRLAQWLPTSAFASSADLGQFRSWIQQHEIDFRQT